MSLKLISLYIATEVTEVTFKYNGRVSVTPQTLIIKLHVKQLYRPARIKHLCFSCYPFC